MDGSSCVIELLQSSIDSKSNNEYLKGFLDSCLELGIFCFKENVEFVVKTINSFLNSSFDTEKGFLLLLAYLPHASVEAFSNNAISWMTHCNKLISQKGVYSDGISLKVLTNLINLSVKFPDINRDTAKEIVPKFLLEQVKRRTTTEVSEEFFHCLKAFMSHYPGPSGDFRSDILRLLLSVVEWPSAVVEAAAGCVPLMAQLGGGGKMGALHKTAWHTQQLGLVALLHTLLNNIYQHIDSLMEVESTPPEDLAMALPTVPEKSALSKTQRLAKQFVSTAVYLQTMLLEEFPVAKCVAADTILHLISHAQKPTHSVLGTSREALAVTSVLPSLQVAALRLLQSLILCVGRNLVPRARLVNHLMCQVVAWTNKHLSWPYAMLKPFSESRFAVYSCVQTWLTVVGALSDMEAVLPVLLSDIHTQKPTVRLQIGSKTNKGKKKQHMLVPAEDRSERLGDMYANRRLCEKALDTLMQLVELAGPSLKVDSLRRIQDTVLTVCGKLSVPFADSGCRCSLYRLLMALCLVNHPRLPPPLAPALAVFSSAIHHSDPQVKGTCLSALSSLEKIVHPSAATLHFPMSKDTQPSSLREEESEEDESAAKRRRVDELEDTASLVVLAGSDNESSIKSLQVEFGEEKLDIDISDDNSIEIVLPDVRLSGNVESSNILESREAVGPSTSIPEHTESNVSCSSDKIENNVSYEFTEETITNEEQSKANDADVTEMLMDFNDEVNNYI